MIFKNRTPVRAKPDLKLDASIPEACPSARRKAARIDTPVAETRRQKRSRRRRWKVVLLLVVTGAVTLCLVYWQSLFWVLTTRKDYFEDSIDGGQIRGWYSRWRESDLESGPYVAYWVENGHKAIEGWAFAGECLSETVWNRDGTVRTQIQWVDESPTPTLTMLLAYWKHGDTPSWAMPKSAERSPWLWPARNETRSSAPSWMLDDGRWQRALAKAETRNSERKP